MLVYFVYKKLTKFLCRNLKNYKFRYAI
ncbi:MAG: hypothetical protein JWQ74_3619, partial [Marmoricola sp.]|nr:hypothetical protein [Marmoricola sp.]